MSFSLQLTSDTITPALRAALGTVQMQARATLAPAMDMIDTLFKKEKWL